MSEPIYRNSPVKHIYLTGFFVFVITVILFVFFFVISGVFGATPFQVHPYTFSIILYLQYSDIRAPGDALNKIS